MIFVTVGSRNYPFDRLFIKLDELCEQGKIHEPIYAQIGTSKYKPKHFEYCEFMSPEEFISKVDESSIVISHGASGSIVKALQHKKKVIAVTRLAKYGEHINDHQIQNNEAFGNAGYVIPVFDLSDDELLNSINLIEEKKDGLKYWENDNSKILNYIDSKIQQWFPNEGEKQND